MGAPRCPGGRVVPPAKRMTVRESSRASSECEAGFARYARADEVYQSLVERISLDPECGTPLARSGPDSDHRIVKSLVLKEAMNPEVRILYKPVRGEGPTGKDTLEVVSVTFSRPPAGRESPTPPSHRV